MNWDEIIKWSGWIVSIIGVLIAFYYGLKSQEQKKRLQTVDWSEIHAATAYLSRKIKIDGVPTVFLATDARGGILSRLIEERYQSDSPILIGFCRLSSDPLSKEDVVGFQKISTPKWTYFIPKKILDYKNSRILLVDDATFTGQSLVSIKNWLIENGCKQISTCTILASEISVKQEICADYFWSVTNQSEMTFPWGRVR